MKRREFWKVSEAGFMGFVGLWRCLKQDLQDFCDLQDCGTGDHEWFPYYEREVEVGWPRRR